MGFFGGLFSTFPQGAQVDRTAYVLSLAAGQLTQNDGTVLECIAGTQSDPASKLLIPLHEKDVSIPTSTSGFNLTITGGSNALTATNIDLYPSAIGGYTWAEIATEMQSRINAAVVGQLGAGTVTVTWSGSSTGGTTGVYVIDAGAGTTAITVLARVGGTDLTSVLFGGTTDQDAVATTWTGAAPRDRGHTGQGWIHAYLKGSENYTDTNCPRLIADSALPDLEGDTTFDSRERAIFVGVQIGFYPGNSTDGHAAAAIGDTQSLSTVRGKGVRFSSSSTLRQAGSVSWNGAGALSQQSAGTATAVELAMIRVLQNRPGTVANRRIANAVWEGFDSGDTAVGTAISFTGTNLAVVSDSYYPFAFWRRDNAATTAAIEWITRCLFAADTGVAHPPTSN